MAIQTDKVLTPAQKTWIDNVEATRNLEQFAKRARNLLVDDFLDPTLYQNTANRYAVGITEFLTVVGEEVLPLAETKEREELRAILVKVVATLDEIEETESPDQHIS
jgi:hypothetical protein